MSENSFKNQVKLSVFETLILSIVRVFEGTSISGPEIKQTAESNMNGAFIRSSTISGAVRRINEKSGDQIIKSGKKGAGYVDALSELTNKI